MRSEAEEFVDGTQVQELPLFAEFVGVLMFAYSAERIIESQHAEMHRFAAGAPSRSVAYDNLGRRLPEIKERLNSDTNFLQDLGSKLDLARSPRRTVEALGVATHPSCELAKDNWDPIFAKVVYHADPYSLQRQSVPDIDFDTFDGPPAPP